MLAPSSTTCHHFPPIPTPNFRMPAPTSTTCHHFPTVPTPNFRMPAPASTTCHRFPTIPRGSPTPICHGLHAPSLRILFLRIALRQHVGFSFCESPHGFSFCGLPFCESPSCGKRSSWEYYRDGCEIEHLGKNSYFSKAFCFCNIEPNQKVQDMQRPGLMKMRKPNVGAQHCLPNFVVRCGRQRPAIPNFVVRCGRQRPARVGSNKEGIICMYCC